MAGSLVPIADEHEENSLIGVCYREIQFSRFFNFPSLSSTCPNLMPLKRSRFKGTWISSSSSTASIQLTTDHSTSDVILTVLFRGKIQEEHIVSKLNFCWPQVSCVSGFPSRGTRVVFVSYRDCAGQIQKFALRFPTTSETQSFISTVEEILKDGKNLALPSNDIVSEISSQSEFVPSPQSPQRVREELNSPTVVDTSSTQMPRSSDYEVEKYPQHSQGTTDSFEEPMAAMPPSFTSLLTNCSYEVKQAQSMAPVEANLKSQIAKYMDDSSFQDMLSKVERIIGELGDEFML